MNGRAPIAELAYGERGVVIGPRGYWGTATVDAVRRDLGRRGFVYRHKPDGATAE